MIEAKNDNHQLLSVLILTTSQLTKLKTTLLCARVVIFGNESRTLSLALSKIATSGHCVAKNDIASSIVLLFLATPSYAWSFLALTSSGVFCHPALGHSASVVHSPGAGGKLSRGVPTRHPGIVFHGALRQLSMPLGGGQVGTCRLFGRSKRAVGNIILQTVTDHDMALKP